MQFTGRVSCPKHQNWLALGGISLQIQKNPQKSMLQIVLYAVVLSSSCCKNRWGSPLRWCLLVVHFPLSQNVRFLAFVFQ